MEFYFIQKIYLVNILAQSPKPFHIKLQNCNLVRRKQPEYVRNESLTCTDLIKR